MLSAGGANAPPVLPPRTCRGVSCPAGSLVVPPSGVLVLRGGVCGSKSDEGPGAGDDSLLLRGVLLALGGLVGITIDDALYISLAVCFWPEPSAAAGVLDWVRTCDAPLDAMLCRLLFSGDVSYPPMSSSSSYAGPGGWAGIVIAGRSPSGWPWCCECWGGRSRSQTWGFLT